YPGHRYIFDFDGSVSRLYGAVPKDAGAAGGPVRARPLWVVLDPTLRVLRVIHFAPDRSDIAALRAYLDGLPPPARFAGFEVPAPVLILPKCVRARILPEADRSLRGARRRGVGVHAGDRRQDHRHP